MLINPELNLIQQLKAMKLDTAARQQKQQQAKEDHRDIMSMFRNSSSPSRMCFRHVCRVK